MQKAGEEANKKTKGRIHGAYREANFAKDQLEIRRESGLCL